MRQLLSWKFADPSSWVTTDQAVAHQTGRTANWSLQSKGPERPLSTQSGDSQKLYRDAFEANPVGVIRVGGARLPKFARVRIREPISRRAPSWPWFPRTRIAARCQRARCAAAMRARPSSVFGPVDSPPCSLHFPLTSALHMQLVPRRVRAPLLRPPWKRHSANIWFEARAPSRAASLRRPEHPEARLLRLLRPCGWLWPGQAQATLQ